jgi:hypothetical protein
LNCVFGRYEDELVRLPQGWRFKRRSFTLAGRTLINTAKLQLNSDFFTAALASIDADKPILTAENPLRTSSSLTSP